MAHLVARRAAAWPWLPRARAARRGSPGRSGSGGCSRISAAASSSSARCSRSSPTSSRSSTATSCSTCSTASRRSRTSTSSACSSRSSARRRRELFDHFDPEPLATASIGQVHVAVLGGRKVAVKVQRPNVDADFMGDIRLMTLAMRLIRRFDDPVALLDARADGGVRRLDARGARLPPRGALRRSAPPQRRRTTRSSACPRSSGI